LNLKVIRYTRKHLIDWYEANQRQLPWRKTDDPYRIWVSEVMLQQTQVKTVISYYIAFIKKFPNIKCLARADQQSVLKIWEGLGYYARARNLHQAARQVVEEHNGSIPDNWKQFKALPGVGDYIAAAVLSIAFHQPFPVVDGNVKRVLARLFAKDTPVNGSGAHKAYYIIAEKLLDSGQAGVFNQALMELGALICRPQISECGRCPLQSVCRVYADESVAEYPKRIKKKPVPEHHIVVGVVYKNGRMLITRRKSEGLLGGLWEFPGGKVKEDETAEQACIREIKEETNLDVKVDSYITRVRHAYTHFKIVMDVFRCQYVSGRVKLNSPVDFKWVTFKQIEQYPFPKANHKFIFYLATLPL
jgi:A/G-specific adenine glycosylase